MKPENCGLDGIAPEGTNVKQCPICGQGTANIHDWNTTQRRIRTERINAAALEIAAARATPTVQGGVSDFAPFTRPYLVPVDCDAALSVAARLIAAQDAAAQARFKAQGGE